MVEDRGLHPAREERIRLAREELVEGVVRGDEDREAPVAPAGAPPLLSQRRHGPRKADGDRAVEEPDVDPQLERVGRGHAEQLALDEAALDLTTLCCGVPGAVGREPLGRRGVDALGREPVDELRRLPALREADRAQPARGQLREEARCVAERARAQAELGVEERRVPDDDLALRARRRVAVDDGRALSRQLERELAGVRDRRGGEQELRLGVVDPREPPKPPEDVRDVRPEHASVDVRLVDDDIAEVCEDVSPAVVVGEDADVEHVRVGEDDVRPLADLPAALARRVAVVDRRLEPLQAELGQRPRLVLRERLRRVEVERPRLRLAGDRVEDGKVECKGLSRCRAGGDDDVLSAPRRFPGLGLVAVQGGDAGRDERGRDARVEVVRQRLELRVAGWLDARVRDLFALEEVSPARRDGRHRCGANSRSKRLRGCAPWTVAFGPPSAKRITVGSERTP